MRQKEKDKIISIIRSELSNDFQTNIDVEIVSSKKPDDIDDYAVKIHAHDNLSENEVSTMEEYYSHLLRLNYRLQNHDWYHQYSDNYTRYKSGQANIEEIKRYLKILGVETYARVYNSIAPDEFKI